jgi:Methyltransferase domain
VSDPQQQLARLREEHDALLRRTAQLERELQAGQASAERQRQIEHLMASGQVIGLSYPVRPRVRYGYGAPPHARLAALLAKEEDRYREHIRGILALLPYLARIASRAQSPTEPFWINEWMPALDAAAIYGFLAARNPRIYLEIGSGMSTKFARRAIRDHGLRTKILSIDPMPRSEIDALCDDVIRQPLQDMEQTRLTSLTVEDMVFFDGSHCCFQNSDATVFFTEILPAMAPGILIGVHDIFLPNDYPEGWLARYYSEQYLLACYLLAGDALSVELPAYYCTLKPELHGILDPLWKNPALAGAEHAGGAFWFTTGRFR